MKKASLLIQEIQTHKYNSIFKDVYVDEHLLSYQKERYVQAIEKFISLYGDQEVEIYSTPGRSEVCGNHTDHQHGEVLVAAINLDIIAVVAPTKETIKVLSDDYDIQGVNIKDLEKEIRKLKVQKVLFEVYVRDISN